MSIGSKSEFGPLGPCHFAPAPYNEFEHTHVH